MRPARLARPLVLATLLGLAGAAIPSGLRAQAHGGAHHQHAHPGAAGAGAQGRHPDPRPGVDAQRVLPADRFQRERHRESYRMARAIPQVLDGLFCHCDCHDRRGLRSLLSCFETEMAASCGICQGQARLAYRLHGEGKSLGEIREAVDRELGNRD